MTCIAIIPARGGSRRIPRKNIKLFHGKPIIAYSIEAAKKSGLFDRIIVSTDDMEIAEVARQYGAEAVMRNWDDPNGDMGTQEVMRRVLLQLGITDGLACCIYPTAPLMCVEDLKEGYLVTVDSRSHCYAVSVGAKPLRDAGQFYWGTVRAFVMSWELWTFPTAAVAVNERRVCDINTPDDWLRAEEMYAKLHGAHGT